MKSTYNFTRVVAVMVIMAAVILIGLQIFGVFSGDEVKDSLKKVVELGAVVIIASILVTMITDRK